MFVVCFIASVLLLGPVVQSGVAELVRLIKSRSRQPFVAALGFDLKDAAWLDEKYVLTMRRNFIAAGRA